jgi:hypothetical protein
MLKDSNASFFPMSIVHSICSERGKTSPNVKRVAADNEEDILLALLLMVVLLGNEEKAASDTLVVVVKMMNAAFRNRTWIIGTNKTR